MSTQPQIHQSLKQYFGFDEFREGQEQTITQLCNGHSTLSIFPTGSGKSLCYQLTALHLEHLTIVVSPLLALMKDQLAFLHSKGIKAASIDSSLTPEQNKQVMFDIQNGELKILMVSVERFKNERFRRFIESVPISMMVVDEAHCISEWGHNFRPDYLKLPQYTKALNIPVTLLLTATATKAVKDDMANKFNIQPQHVVQTGFYRSNLHLQVVPVSEFQKNQTLLNQLKQQQGAGIIYVTLQHTAAQVAQFLTDQGVNAAMYHAGLEPEQRKNIQDNFMASNIDVVVATIAFGMGIDKSDIRFVIHYDLPKSIENYSQEIGRGGRDGGRANCILLANLDGVNVLENFIYGDTPEYLDIKAVLDDIKENQASGIWEVLITQLSSLSNIRQLPLKTLLVQLELKQIIKAKYSYYAQVKLKLLKPVAEILAGFNVERQQFLKTIFDFTPIKKVWGTPDIDAITRQSGSDYNRVMAALDYLDQKEMIEMQTQKMTDVYSVNQQATIDGELNQNLADYFYHNQQKELARIEQLVNFFAKDSCLTKALTTYFDDHQLTQNCGHCSVCLGQVATLTHSSSVSFPDDQILNHSIAEFCHVVNAKFGQNPSTGQICRFLMGMPLAKYSRLGLKKLVGFSVCERQSFLTLEQKIKQLGY